MDKVTVSKEQLLGILRANKDKHVQIYTDAMEGLCVEYKKILEREIKKIDGGKSFKSSVRIEVPTNHEKEYTKVIQMLEMSVDSDITLTSREFGMYVQDEWITNSEKSLLRTYALSSSNSALYGA